MDETYRMLGREHQADLEREALNRRRASEVGGRVTRASGDSVRGGPKRAQLMRARVAALIGRPARAQA